MQFKRYLILTLSLLVLACGKESFDTPAASGPVTVGFVVGGADTRTTINDDGISTSWEKGDRIALWATSSDGSATLSEQEFSIYYRDGSLAMFTAKLPSAMAEGTYNYWATYPMPKTVNGTKATFNLPGTQDGSMSGGAAIMVAQPAQGPQLSKVTDIPKYSEIYDEHLSLKMKHATHALRFFAPSNKWGFNDGEKIERIQFTMPQGIAGDLTLDYTDPDAAGTTANTSNTIVLNLTKPIGASASASALEHACAAILPTAAFAAGDAISMKIYSKTQIVEQAISLAGRGAMQAGHITPVALDCSSPVEQPKIAFRIKTNNLGEQPYRITLTSKDTNTKWLITDDHIYEYYTGSTTSTIADGKGFDIHYDEETLASISGQSVTVTYESESAIVTNAITMPAMTAGNNYTVELTVPYLMYQDFSSIAEYNDEATTGSKTLDNVGLPGWTASRTRSTAGSHMRLRPFYAIIGRYQGRMDSEFFGSRLKKSVTVKVTINAGADQVATPLQVGKTTTAGAIEAGTAIESVSTTLNLPKGTSSSRPSYTYTVAGVTANHRLSWRTNITSGSWATYSDTPIDNIKVSITK
jgi:hypothetical protein